MKNQVVPVGKRVLIKQSEAAQTYGVSGILIPDSQQIKECKGEVVAVGKEVKEIKEGDSIQYADYITPVEMQHNNENHLLISVGDILAIII